MRERIERSLKSLWTTFYLHYFFLRAKYAPLQKREVSQIPETDDTEIISMELYGDVWEILRDYWSSYRDGRRLWDEQNKLEEQFYFILDGLRTDSQMVPKANQTYIIATPEIDHFPIIITLWDEKDTTTISLDTASIYFDDASSNGMSMNKGYKIHLVLSQSGIDQVCVYKSKFDVRPPQE